MRHDLSSSRSAPPFPLRPPRSGGERALPPFVWLVALAGGAVVAVAGPKWGPFLVAGACLLGLVSAWAWRRPDAALAGLALLIPLQVRLNLPGNWSLAVGFVAISGLAAVVVYRQLLNADPGSLREPPGVLPPATLPAPFQGTLPRRGIGWVARGETPGGRGAAGGNTPGGPEGAESLSLVLFTGAAVTSLWAAPDLGEAGRRLLYLGWFLVLFWLVPRCIRSEAALERVLRAVFLASVIAAFLGVAQFALQFVVGTLPLYYFWLHFVTPILEGERVAATYLQYSNNWILWTGSRPCMRAIGPFSGPPDAAQYLGVCLPLVVAHMFQRPRLRARDLAALGILLVFLAATFSRQAWVALAAALPAMYLASWQLAISPTAGHLRRRLGSLVASGVLLLGMGLGVGLANRGGTAGRLVDRLLSIGDRSDISNVQRFQTWSQALEQIERHPALGAGVGNYGISLGERRSAYSHNTYLDVLVETGPLGLLGLLALLGWGLGSAWHVVCRARTAGLQAVGLGAVGALVALAVIFVFDDAFYFPRAGQAFWLLMGLLAAARQMVSAVEKQAEGGGPG